MKGYLEHEQLTFFQKIVAYREEIKITSAEEDMIIVAFMRNLPKN